MIPFWRKAEVYTGYSIQRFNEARDVLEAAKIKHDYRIVNHEGSQSASTSRSRTGSGHIKSEYANLYTIYVHEKDFEEARRLLEGRRSI